MTIEWLLNDNLMTSVFGLRSSNFELPSHKYNIHLFPLINRNQINYVDFYKYNCRMIVVITII